MTVWQHFKCHAGHTYFGVLGQRCPECEKLDSLEWVEQTLV